MEPSTAPPDPTPSAEPAPTPEPTPAETFAPITLKGKGSKIPRFTIPADTPAIATIRYTGGGNFAVWTIGPDGSNQDLLVNVIGAYAGTVLFGVDYHPIAFRIESSGSWTATVMAITRSRTWDTTKALTGKGDDVAQLSPTVSGFASTTVVHRGRSNFAVWSYSPSERDLLINEIGNYKGEVLLPDGTVLVEITADGAWSFTAPQ